MRQVTKEEGEKFYEAASNWYLTAENTDMYHDVKRVAISAVAEYLANQEDLTMFKMRGQ